MPFDLVDAYEVAQDHEAKITYLYDALVKKGIIETPKNKTQEEVKKDGT